ncbi:MAG: phosphoribulokinase [Methanomicrobiales archaeon]|nr:phosphoribulokinase [Methanomicrobiales archaeon]
MNGQSFTDVIRASPRIFVIGVAGDSGSGKTTFTQGIRSLVGEDLVTTITLDDYHRFDREERAARQITPLHPDANRINRIEEDLAALRAGKEIEKPVYIHATGRFGTPVRLSSRKVLILEGLHTLFTERLRSLLDFSIFVDPDRSVKYEWKMRRDVGERGYRPGDVEREIAEREPDYLRFIAPQRDHAEAVITLRHSKYGRELGAARNVYQVAVSQSRMKRGGEEIDLLLDLYSILSLSERDFLLEFTRTDRDGRRMGDLIIDGELTSHVVERLERSIEDQTGVRPISLFRHRDYVTAGDLAQLILCWRIIHRRLLLQVG